MEAYGYSDWDGNDRHFMGWAGTGVHFDPVIASNAAHWLRSNAGTGPGRPATPPWFLTVALVNPHDVMWFPIDQPGYAERHPDEVAGDPPRPREPPPGRTTTRSRSTARTYDEVFDELPANFSDDLHAKPEAHRQWRWDQQHGLWGYIDPSDTKAWLRHLDYYVELHRLADRESRDRPRRPGGERCVGRHRRDLHLGPRRHVRLPRPSVQGPVRLRRDHAGAAVRAGPGCDAGRRRRPTPWPPTSTWPPPICALAGVDPAAPPGGTAGPTLQGVDLSPVLAEPAVTVRDHVLFAQDSAQTQNLNTVRYALRGFFDGTTKYARYYGVGGGKPSTGLWGKDPGRKLFDVDCDFDDQDHEWYDHDTDPLELVNLANDRSPTRAELRDLFGRLRAYESDEMERL